GRTRVPAAYVKDGQIVMNISAGATRNLMLDNDWIQFSARFGGVSHEISIPVDRVAAIFARENGQGLHFEPVDSTEDPFGWRPGSAESQTRVKGCEVRLSLRRAASL
ncbi:MAG: ClpXP protease specificity-enhancing factor SspB, partial [Gammaproteobacteria bacterium]